MSPSPNTAVRPESLLAVVDDLAPVGVVTARDIMARVTASGLDPAKVAVEAVMSSPLVTVAEDGSVSDALAVMGNHGIRRVPVVNEAGRLVMLLTMDDILMLNLAAGGCARAAGRNESTDIEP